MRKSIFILFCFMVTNICFSDTKFSMHGTNTKNPSFFFISTTVHPNYFESLNASIKSICLSFLKKNDKLSIAEKDFIQALSNIQISKEETVKILKQVNKEYKKDVPYNVPMSKEYYVGNILYKKGFFDLHLNKKYNDKVAISFIYGGTNTDDLVIEFLFLYSPSDFKDNTVLYKFSVETKLAVIVSYNGKQRYIKPRLVSNYDFEYSLAYLHSFTEPDYVD